MKHHFEAFSREEHETINQETIDAAYARAQKILSEPIKPEDFADIYRDVENDIAFVQHREKEFAAQAAAESVEMQNRRKIGKIFEAIIFEQSELSDWFGENAITIAASRYDDIVNKVDAIIEFEEGPASASHLALAMDVTTAEDFDDKFNYIKESINRGELTKIKYFSSEKIDIRGEKSNVPHVVIAVDRQTLFDVIGAWVRKDAKKLADHPVQVKILEETRLQLVAFRAYAASIGQTKVVAVYEKALTIINEVMNSKGITEDDIKRNGDDEMFRKIRTSAENIRYWQTQEKRNTRDTFNNGS